MADIDVPPTWSDLSFSSAYPLPFRVLFLSFSTLLGFATNLHILAHLGIDTALVLDIRLDDFRASSQPRPGGSSAAYVHPSRLYPPLYALAAIGLAWTAAGWTVFSKITGGVPEEMVRWRGIPAATAVMVGVATVVPWNVLYRKERMMFLRALRRTIFSSLYSAVPFCDIILADILTSSAKVLGDVWVSGCLLFTVTSRFGLGEDDGDRCARVFMVPVMTCLPYLFRFRQCVSEVVTGSTPTPRRSVMNAIKYASAFPVILFSAMQTVLGDPFDDAEKEEKAWISRSALFQLWILAVLINSLYSFWWDVTNDWGLSLLTPAGWSKTPQTYNFTGSPAPTSSSRNPHLPTGAPLESSAHARVRSQAAALLTPASAASPDVSAGGIAYPPPPSRPQTPPPPIRHARPRAHHTRAFSTASSPNLSYPFLRPILLLPDPTIYYLAIAIDLLLRFTWSLKLSSHLHSIHEIESGIFLMEALEVVRRWMWVYLRIEWEAVRKGGGGLESAADRAGREEELVGLGTLPSGGGYRDEEEVDGLGIGIMVTGEKGAP